MKRQAKNFLLAITDQVRLKTSSNNQNGLFNFCQTNINTDQILKSTAIIASEGGNLYSFNEESGNIQLIFHTDEYLMGIAQQDNIFYVSGSQRLYKIDNGSVYCTKHFTPFVNFHHINIYENKIYVTATLVNQIWVFDLDLNIIEKIRISPPDPRRKVKAGKNYNHINGIFLHKDKFYACLNWLDKQWGYSGVAEFDSKFKELKRYKYGWQSHALQIINENLVTLCATTPGKVISHPGRSGLFVDGQLVFEHSTDVLCKDFAYNNKNYILAGGQAANRSQRKTATGHIYILDKNFKLVKELIFPSTGGFKGALTLNKNNHQ